MSDLAPIRSAIDEFESLGETNHPIQLLDGEIVIGVSPNPLHQQTSGRIVSAIQEIMLNGELFYAPMDVYFDADNIPQPDLIWVAENSRCKVGAKRLEGAPDLIIEILSGSTAANDRGYKFTLYEKYAVTEYWLIDPDAQFVEVFFHDGMHYVRQGLFQSGQTFISIVLGNKVVDVSKLFG